MPTALLGCAHPSLEVAPSTPTATVEFSNASSGYSNLYFFEDPKTCSGTSVVANLSAREKKTVRIPADRTITLLASAWNLPSPTAGAHVSCRLMAFSTRLKAGASYTTEFSYDAANQCILRIRSADDPLVKQIKREADGPPIGGSKLTQDFSCNPANDLSALAR
jgi:hypothetical protein